MRFLSLPSVMKAAENIIAANFINSTGGHDDQL
jgi:hypothetical protein